MSDEPQRHRIQVSCPECGHRQTEPALVISTQCRSCYRNFAVRNGEGVPRNLGTARIANVRPEGAEAPDLPPPAAKPAPPRKPTPPKKPLLLRLLGRRRKPREVVCFGCAHEFSAIPEASSSQCPKCGCYISLADHDVDEVWKRRIMTRGNVTIRKSGEVSGTTVECHHLTVFGTLHCDASCSGDLVIRTNGRFTGNLRCRNLRVEKASRVEFLHPVIVENSATLDGDIRGQIFCSGPALLEKRSRFQGLIRTTSLTVRPGAMQNGTVEEISPSQRPTHTH